MATVRTATVVDDVDGKSEATHKVSITLDGTRYSLDLSDVTFEAFKQAVKHYTDVARKGAVGATSDSDTAKIRQWARENGIQVGARGTVKPEIVKQFNEATASTDKAELKSTPKPEAKPTNRPKSPTRATVAA